MISCSDLSVDRITYFYNWYFAAFSARTSFTIIWKTRLYVVLKTLSWFRAYHSIGFKFPNHWCSLTSIHTTNTSLFRPLLNEWWNHCFLNNFVVNWNILFLKNEIYLNIFSKDFHFPQFSHSLKILWLFFSILINVVFYVWFMTFTLNFLAIKSIIIFY